MSDIKNWRKMAEDAGIYHPFQSTNSSSAVVKLMIEDLERLTQENESLRKDAERYRWLRECDMFRSDRNFHITQSHYALGQFLRQTNPSMEDLDIAIDKAMKDK